MLIWKIVKKILYILISLTLAVIIVFLIDTYQSRALGPLDFDIKLNDRQFYGNGFRFDKKVGYNYYYYTKDMTYDLNDKKVRVKLRAEFAGIGEFDQFDYYGLQICFQSIKEKEIYTNFLQSRFNIKNKNETNKKDLLLIGRENGHQRVLIDTTFNDENPEIVYKHLFDQNSLCVYVYKPEMRTWTFKNKLNLYEKRIFLDYINKKCWPPWIEQFK